MRHHRQKFTDKDVDNVYYNITIPGREGEDVLAQYDSTRRDTILSRPCDYYLSVVRFAIPANTIPIFYMPVQTGIAQTNRNLTPLSFTFEYGGVIIQEFLIYQPRNLTFPNTRPPSENNGVQDITPFYYIYDYNQFVFLLNKTLSNLFTLLALSTAGLPPDTDPDIPPYFLYDEDTNRLEIVWPTSFLASNLMFYANADMFNYVEHIGEAFFYGYDTSFGRVFSFNFIQNFGRYQFDHAYYPNPQYPQLAPPAYDPLNPPDYEDPLTPFPFPRPKLNKFVQTDSTLEYWYSFKKLILISNHLPIRKEYVPARNALANPLDNEGVNLSMPILTDFEPNLNPRNGPLREIFTYVADGQYRLIDMCSEVPLKKIDLQIYWADKEGNLFPLYISPTNEVSIKLAFMKKNLFKHTHIDEK